MYCNKYFGNQCSYEEMHVINVYFVTKTTNILTAFHNHGNQWQCSEEQQLIAFLIHQCL